MSTGVIVLTHFEPPLRVVLLGLQAERCDVVGDERVFFFLEAIQHVEEGLTLLGDGLETIRKSRSCARIRGLNRFFLLA